MNKTVFFLMLQLVFLFSVVGRSAPTLFQTFGTIYIRTSGEVDPPTAPISNIGNATYTLLDNLNGSIIIERNNITIDGADHILTGNRSIGSKGILLVGNSNVTVKNFEVRDFAYGIFLSGSANCNISKNRLVGNIQAGLGLWVSSNNHITQTNATNNYRGVWIDHSYNNTFDNNRLVNNVYGWDVSGVNPAHFVNHADASNTVNGKPVRYWVNKENATVPTNAGYVVLANCTSITVQNVNVTSNVQGILLAYTKNSTITDGYARANRYGIQLYNSSDNTVSANILTSNEYGIMLQYSSNNDITGNNVTANTQEGIRLDVDCSYNVISANQLVNNGRGVFAGYSSYNNITKNNIADNGLHGVWLWESSDHCIIAGNNITGNQYLGIELEYSSFSMITRNNIADNVFYGINLYDSSNNIITRNNIADNMFNIQFYGSINSSIYNNNFINNLPRMTDQISANFWDNGNLSGGNYWNAYKGPDANKDGISDKPYTIDAENVDNYPLMGSISSFNTSQGSEVNVISNSTISSFQYFAANKTIEMVLSSAELNQTEGFCRLTIPHNVMAPPYIISIDNSLTQYNVIYEDNDQSILYFDYEHSSLEVVIVPQFPSVTFLLILVLVTTVAALYCHQKLPNLGEERLGSENQIC